MTVEMSEQSKAWCDLVKDLVAVASNAIQLYAGVKHTRQQHAFIMLLNRATENVGAMMCLFESGWENDAMALMRTLTEIYIDVRYIRADPETLGPRFLDYSLVSNRWKKDLIERVYRRPVDDLIREDYLRANTAGAVREDIQTADDYVARYHAEVARSQARWNFRRSGWAQLDARSKATFVDQRTDNGLSETETVYDLIYRMTSEALHSGIGGVLRSVTFDGAIATLNHQARPSRPGGILVLTFASFMFMKVLDYTNAELDLGLEADLRRLEAQQTALLGPVRIPPQTPGTPIT